jgi:hypothetical protein
MKKFDVLVKVSFFDRYMVEAEDEFSARQQINEMFDAQDEMPNTPMLDWVTESLYVAKQDGMLLCDIEELISWEERKDQEDNS